MYINTHTHTHTYACVGERGEIDREREREYAYLCASPPGGESVMVFKFKPTVYCSSSCAITSVSSSSPRSLACC